MSSRVEFLDHANIGSPPDILSLQGSNYNSRMQETQLSQEVYVRDEAKMDFSMMDNNSEGKSKPPKFEPLKSRQGYRYRQQS